MTMDDAPSIPPSSILAVDPVVDSLRADLETTRESVAAFARTAERVAGASNATTPRRRLAGGDFVDEGAGALDKEFGDFGDAIYDLDDDERRRLAHRVASEIRRLTRELASSRDESRDRAAAVSSLEAKVATLESQSATLEDAAEIATRESKALRDELTSLRDENTSLRAAADAARDAVATANAANVKSQNDLESGASRVARLFETKCR